MDRMKKSEVNPLVFVLLILLTFFYCLFYLVKALFTVSEEDEQVDTNTYATVKCELVLERPFH